MMHYMKEFLKRGSRMKSRQVKFSEVHLKQHWSTGVLYKHMQKDTRSAEQKVEIMHVLNQGQTKSHQ